MTTASPPATDASTQLVRRLIRATHHTPEAAAGLIAVINTDPKTYLPLALTMARYGAGPVDTALATAITNTDLTYMESATLEEMIPLRSGILPHAALAAAEQRRRQAASDTEIAIAQRKLGGRLGEVGRRREAVAAAEEAVALFRQLVAADP
ncbi:hypothetical protein ABZ471_47935, partial [Streptomyces sp. NPDC005728]|uniref:hypothetical protein n=1 Tax=Streptomyces sp. NPDC005728 TaxID=3157054 RepID=UPI0033CB6AC0